MYSTELIKFVQELADEDCTYGDDCPTFGSRHGKCIRCRAVAILTQNKKEKNNEN